MWDSSTTVSLDYQLIHDSSEPEIMLIKFMVWNQIKSVNLSTQLLEFFEIWVPWNWNGENTKQTDTYRLVRVLHVWLHGG